MEKFKLQNKDQLARLPKSPGVYCFKKGKEFLYIGKASSIKERIKNHFQQPTSRDNLFIGQVSKIGYLRTDSEIEALVLEAKLIKKYQPKYNVAWRDDKNYFYLGLGKEKFPQVFITHQPASLQRQTKIKMRTPFSSPKLKIDYVGPFVDGKALKQTLKILRKVFPYRTCRNLPKKPCLWYQLDRCPAPCLLKSELMKQTGRVPLSVSEKDYQRNIRNLVKILQGEKQKTLKDLKGEMEELAKKKLFERAAETRDQIRALERVMLHAKIFELTEPKPEPDKGWPEIQKILQKILKTKKKIKRLEAYDVSNIQGEEATGSLVTFIEGQPDKNFYRRFKIRIAGKPNDTAMIKECLERRLKHREWDWPNLILIDGGKPQLNAAKKIVKKKIPLLALAKKNNELFIDGRRKPILLKNLPQEISNLILYLRDEAHRFALTYHRKLRQRALLEK